MPLSQSFESRVRFLYLFPLSTNVETNVYTGVLRNIHAVPRWPQATRCHKPPHGYLHHSYHRFQLSTNQHHAPVITHRKFCGVSMTASMMQMSRFQLEMSRARQCKLPFGMQMGL